MTIARVALPVALDQFFDYWVPAGLAIAPGNIVEAHLGARRLHGVVVHVDGEATLAPERMRPIDAVADAAALPPDILDLCRFVASYYQAPVGQVLALALPPLGVSARVRRKAAPEDPAAGTAGAHHSRNAAQQTSLAAIVAASGTYAPFLLNGVTGSGKTEVYLDAAARAIAAGGQVLILVPEINLTPTSRPACARRSRTCARSRCTAASRRACAGGTGRRPRAARLIWCSARGSPSSRRCRGSRW